jgi:hypothetical protein
MQITQGASDSLFHALVPLTISLPALIEEAHTASAPEETVNVRSTEKHLRVVALMCLLESAGEDVADTVMDLICARPEAQA